MPDDVIVLRTYRYHLRKSRIEIVGDNALLILPAYFGSRRFTVPLREITIADLTSPTLVEPVDDVFRRPSMIPYFFTTGPATSPTTVLLFGEPQRVPPLKVGAAFVPNLDLPLGWLESRSAHGAHLDGVELRTVDPPDAARRLTRVGASRTDDPAQWLRDHPEVVDDPIEREELLTEARTVRRLYLGSIGLMYGALFTAGGLIERDEVPMLLLGLAGLAGSLGLVLWLTVKQRIARMGEDRRPVGPDTSDR